MTTSMSIQAKITNRTGHSGRDRIYFEARLPTFGAQSDMQELAKVGQAELGYDHRGYGGPFSVQIEVLNEGGYLLTWACAASCE